MDQNTVMVSVIIPCYNSQDTICACVASALQQTYSDFEIIVIDDGSKDQSVQVLKDYLERLKYDTGNINIISQKNAGPSAARNHGISLAKGKYIAFLDSDDQWHPAKLMTQIKHLENNYDIQLISCGYNNRTEKGRKELMIIPFKALLRKNYFAATSTVMVRKEALNNLSFNIRQKHSEDYRLWLQLSWKGTCVLVSESLASSISQKLEYGEAGLSANLWKMEKGELSNYRFIYKQGYISIFSFLSSCCLSILKYVRRKIIVIMKR